MFARKARLRWAAWFAVTALGGLAWARGIELTESQKQLGLDHEFSATATGGSVRVQLTINDLEGKKGQNYFLSPRVISRIA